MSFELTADVILSSKDDAGKLTIYKPIKPSSLKWERSIDTYSDSATIVIPAIAMMKKGGDQYKQVDTGEQLKEGMMVEIKAGYDGANSTRFKGFIKRRNFKSPFEMECEGYAYQLRKKLNYSASYKSVKLKALLADLVKGTDIKLSDNIPDWNLDKIWFKNVSGLQVLDYLKSNCAVSIYFNYDVLYAGLRYVEAKGELKLRLGYNVIKDNELKFEVDKELATVNVNFSQRQKDGSYSLVEYGSKDGVKKEIKVIHISELEALNALAKDRQRELASRGYEGSLTTFLIPFAQPGMSALIDDPRYKERKGRYFIESVGGELSTSGGRQKVKIGATL